MDPPLEQDFEWPFEPPRDPPFEQAFEWPFDFAFEQAFDFRSPLLQVGGVGRLHVTGGGGV